MSLSRGTLLASSTQPTIDQVDVGAIFGSPSPFYALYRPYISAASIIALMFASGDPGGILLPS